MEDKEIIKTENLTFDYTVFDENGEETGKNRILTDIDLSIEKGSFVAVLGHNGSGKSTLAKHMNAILVPDEGRVLINGIDTADEERVLDVRRCVGMVFQNPDNQIVANVVEDDVAFAPENLGVPPQEIRRRVDAALTQVGMYELREHAPHLLSGGQKQRLSIARALARTPEILIFDDSFSALDYKTDATLREGLAKELPGTTKIIVAQRISTIRNADQILVLDRGEIAGLRTHDALMASCTVYREIAMSQLSEEELKKGGASK